mmetsp:Transcript_14904/g.23127  ORF Transcript_14904/g.23127 Transcript_14904/m.23127 type:complete len:684 (+) Transcript_14904:76-2127(+)
MEYERALFRVYDRIMDDLSATGSPSPQAVDDMPMCCFPFALPTGVIHRATTRISSTRHPYSLLGLHGNSHINTSGAEEESTGNEMVEMEEGRSSRTSRNDSDDASVNEQSSDGNDGVSIPRGNSNLAPPVNEGPDEFCSHSCLGKTMMVLFLFGVVQCLIIACLHKTYVGRGDCIQHALKSRTNATLARDEILQIKVLQNHVCHQVVGPCSRVHVYGEYNNNVTFFGDDVDDDEDDEEGRDIDYRFTTSEALLYLDKRLIFNHNITLVNVTLSERCLSTGTDDVNARFTFFTRFAEVWSSAFTGYDSPVINQLMYGILNSTRTYPNAFRNGYLMNMETKEHWSWHKELIAGYEEVTGFLNIFRHPVDWILHKIGSFFVSCLAFFLITSVTALIVRVLTTSGVVLMYPLFSCFRRYFGLNGASERILGLSYPWMGLALQRASNPPSRSSESRQHSISNHMVKHMLTSHISKVALYYIMYEACQAAWSTVLYAKSVPDGLPVYLYGLTMIWEYFSMIFMRSALTIFFFPRCIWVLFLGYHFYFHSVPYAYFDVALIPLLVFSIQAMIYCVLILETRVHRSGLVSLECPREVFSAVPWPEWSASFPAEWTLFLPLNSRTVPLYDMQVNENSRQTDDAVIDSDDDSSDDSDDGDDGGVDDADSDGSFVTNRNHSGRLRNRLPLSRDY